MSSTNYGVCHECRRRVPAEDVEQIIDDAFPEEPVEFIPAGLGEHLRLSARFFGVLRLKFGGARPNCESAALKVLGGVLAGRKFKTQMRRHGNAHDVMLMFGEYRSVESAWLQSCRTGFVCEDPATDEVKTIPACMWGMYRNDLQRRIAGKYERQGAGAAHSA